MKRILIFFVTMMMLGCGTGKQSNVAQLVESVEESAVQAPMLLPMQMAVSGEVAQGRTQLTVRVTYAVDIAVPVTLLVETSRPSDIVGESVVTLPAGERGTVRQHTFELEGEAVSAKIRASFFEAGMGAEVHESWPAERSAQVRGAQEKGDIMEALPAPIEVDGVQIFRGVEVRP